MQQYIRNLLLPFYAYLGILKKESIAPETGQHIGYTAFPYPICCGKLFSIHHRLRQKKSAADPLPAKGGYWGRLRPRRRYLDSTRLWSRKKSICSARSRIARLVPPMAGELFAKPSFYRLFTSSSIYMSHPRILENLPSPGL